MIRIIAPISLLILTLLVILYNKNKELERVKNENNRLRDKLVDKIWFDDFEGGGKYAGDC